MLVFTDKCTIHKSVPIIKNVPMIKKVVVNKALGELLPK